jgi:hypothetical protein
MYRVIKREKLPILCQLYMDNHPNLSQEIFV